MQSEVSASSASSREFSKLRAFFWPIHAHETKKFIPLGLLMFCTVFNYTILHDAKDTLIITAAGGGAALIPFLKVGLTLPVALLFVAVYSKLSNIMTQQWLFYCISSVFLAMVAVFAFALYPNHVALHPDPHWIKQLQTSFPTFQVWFAVFGLWTFSFFYVACELWGVVIITLLFWQFANEVTRSHEAKRFYSYFGLIANCSLIFSGLTTKFVGNLRHCYPADVDVWGITIQYLMLAVLVVGAVMILIYRWMHANVLTDPTCYTSSNCVSIRKTPTSLKESTRYILKSSYLGYIAILVLSYNFCSNILDVVWKHQIKLQYPHPSDYCVFIGNFTAIMGVATILLVIFFKGVVQRLGWIVGAILPPILMLVAALPFFASVCFGNQLLNISATLYTTPLMIAILLGAVQEIASKGSKYALFDPTKEIAYLPLDQELKSKGKALVDVAGSKLGKAISGLIVGVLFMITGCSDISKSTPYFAILVVTVIAIWMVAVWKLSKLYQIQVQLNRAAEPSTRAPTAPVPEWAEAA